MGTAAVGERPPPLIHGGLFMLSSRRLTQFAVLGLVAVVAAWGVATQLRANDNDAVEKQKRIAAELKAKQEQQRQVQEETDKLVSRLTASIRLLTYYKLDGKEESQLLTK